MSRLDLLKKSTSVSDESKKNTPKSPRGGMLGEKTQKSQQREKDLNDDILTEDDFENELENSSANTYTIDDDQDDESSEESVNVIEIDLDLNQDQNQVSDIGSSLVEEEIDSLEEAETPSQASPETIKENETEDIVEGNISVDYSEEDIKLEVEYTFDQRDQLYHTYVKAIKDGGIEIGSSKLLNLGDIVRISVTLTELKEQVGCEARIVSVFPKNIRSSDDQNENTFRYIVQFIGPNAPETERVLSKYLLGFKIK